MLRSPLLLAAGLLALAATPVSAAPNNAVVKNFLSTYCIECHGPEKQKGDRRFDELLLPAANEDTLIDLKDIDGKPFIKERVDMAKTQASFWQDYKFTNPTTKKIEPKTMYCERLDQTVVCGGVYK